MEKQQPAAPMVHRHGGLLFRSLPAGTRCGQWIGLYLSGFLGDQLWKL